MDIKICGLSTDEAIEAVIANIPRGATHAGFIFFARSPRNVTPERAAPLAAKASAAGLSSVAVTVDADDGYLGAIVSTMKPDMLQLHGSETPERVAEIKARHGLPVMKALAIREAADLAKMTPYLGVADRFLFDAKPPKGSELPGGNGVTFDWSLLIGIDPGIDWLLSGGLNADNAGEAISTLHPPGLDISSGVESAPGIKDAGLIDSFFLAAQRA